MREGSAIGLWPSHVCACWPELLAHGCMSHVSYLSMAAENSSFVAGENCTLCFCRHRSETEPNGNWKVSHPRPFC